MCEYREQLWSSMARILDKEFSDIFFKMGHTTTINFIYDAIATKAKKEGLLQKCEK